MFWVRGIVTLGKSGNWDQLTVEEVVSRGSLSVQVLPGELRCGEEDGALVNLRAHERPTERAKRVFASTVVGLQRIQPSWMDFFSVLLFENNYFHSGWII